MNKFINDSKRLAEIIGKDNIISATHCQTRLRLVLKDPKRVKVDEIEKLDSVQGTFRAQGQFQIIIGTKVPEFYKYFISEANIGYTSKEEAKVQAKKQANKFQKAMTMFSEIFVPIIPVIVAGGLILAFRNVLELDWGNGWTIVDSHEFWSYLNAILWLPANAVFWYLPVYVCWAIFNREKESPAVGIAIGIMLVSPGILINYYDISGAVNSYHLSEANTYINPEGITVVALSSGIYDLETIASALVVADYPGTDAWDYVVIDGEIIWSELPSLESINEILAIQGIGDVIYISNIGDAIKASSAYYFWGWPFAIGYVGQVIPALLVGVFSLWLYKFIKRHSWSSIEYVWPPFVVIIVTLFVAHGIIGPIGAASSWVVTTSFEWAFTDEIAKFFFAPIFGLLYPVIVITGLHHTLNAVMLELSAIGANYIFPILALSKLAQGAAVFGVVWLARRDKKMMELGTSSGATCWLGVTEPAMFGINLKYMFPFIAAMLASSIGATLSVVFNITANGIGMGGILGFLNINQTLVSWPQWSAWLIFWMIMIITVLSAFIFTVFLSKKSKWFSKISSGEWEEYIEDVRKIPVEKNIKKTKK